MPDKRAYFKRRRVKRDLPICEVTLSGHTSQKKRIPKGGKQKRHFLTRNLYICDCHSFIHVTSSCVRIESRDMTLGGHTSQKRHFLTRNLYICDSFIHVTSSYVRIESRDMTLGGHTSQKGVFQQSHFLTRNLCTCDSFIHVTPLCLCEI